MQHGTEIFLNGKRLRVTLRQVIGKGGEAEVYDIGHGRALKLYKTPDHPDFQMQPEARAAARQRLAEQQQKLHDFPRGLPPQVVVPDALATADVTGHDIIGYAMPLVQPATVLLHYADRAWREQGGVTQDDVVAVFQHLRRTLAALHQAEVVIGDFNDLNVLVRPDHEVGVIDADSFQFGLYPCRVFTARFVDPLLCDAAASTLILQRAHNRDSDWYAFCVMLMQCLLYVDPHGGLYRPKDSTQRLPHHLRSLRRITVFHPEVKYPKPALRYDVLPDDLLDHFQAVFEHDRRGEFPARLIETLRWTTCARCGQPYARPHCPTCFKQQAQAVQSTTTIRGTVTATRLLQTHGIVLEVAWQHGRLRTLYHERGTFKRETGTVVMQGDRDPRARFRLLGDATLAGRDGIVSVMRPGRTDERVAVDTFDASPVFDSNQRDLLWLQGGQLWRQGRYGPEYIGDTLPSRTQFWVGPEFGFGWYYAGSLQVAFVFNAHEDGLNDAVPLPRVSGQVFDAACAFSDDRCWFFTAAQESGRIVLRCCVVRANGSVEASGQAEPGDGSWLSTNLHGRCASGTFLLVPTDDGVVRVEVVQGQLAVTRTFPDTEPFVTAQSRLLASPNGLYVVGPQDITLLTIR